MTRAPTREAPDAYVLLRTWKCSGVRDILLMSFLHRGLTLGSLLLRLAFSTTPELSSKEGGISHLGGSLFQVLIRIYSGAHTSSITDSTFFY